MKKIFDYFSPVIFLLQEDKKKVPFIFFLILTVSLLDLIGLGVIGPMVGVILTNSQTNTSILSSYDYLNYFNFIDSKDLLLYFSITLFLVFLFKMIIGIYSIYIMHKFSLYRATSIVKTLSESALSAPYVEHIDKNSSEIVSNIERHSYIYGSLMFQLFKTLSDSTIIIFLSLFMILTEPIFTTSLIIIFLILGIIYIQFFRNRVSGYGQQSIDSVQKLIKLILESMRGFQEIKTLSIEKYIRDNITQSSKDLSDAYIKQSVISSWPRLFLELVFITVIILVIQVLTYREINFIEIAPLIVMFMYISVRMLPLFTNIMQLAFLFNFHMPAIKTLSQNVKYADTFLSKNLFINSEESFETIEFSDVSFSYKNKKNIKILDSVNFKINKNDIIGIIGDSGSGKSTLLNILLGFLTPDSGSLKFNNSIVGEDNLSIRSKVFYIPQQSFFLDDTIEKNIALGFNEDEIDRDLLNLSLHKAGLDNFIDNLHMGTKTIIGENGVKISGGQKQRISIARSFYHKREIVILDESTNALDEKNTTKIINEIKSLSFEKTFIIVSHQKDILTICNKILSLKEGKLEVKNVKRDNYV